MIFNARCILVGFLAIALQTAGLSIAAEPAAWSDWTDWLPKVHEKNHVEGHWKWTGKSLTASANSPSSVPLPVELDGQSYDLRVECTRNRGQGSILVGLPVGSHFCTLALDLPGDKSALSAIDRQEAAADATRRPSTIASGKRYTVLAKVRLHAKTVTIEVLLDKEPYLKWSGDEGRISLPNWSHPSYPNRPFLGGGGTDVSFHSAWVRTLEPQLTPDLLRKKLRGRATFDAKTRVLTVSYDFKHKRQLEDFEGSQVLGNGHLAVPTGQHASHVVKFKTVTVRGVCAMQSPKAGDLISTTGGFVAARHGTTLTVSGPGARVSNQVGPPNAMTVSPFQLTLAEKMAFTLGGEVAKERKDVPVGQVQLLGGLAGAAYTNLTLSGEVDMGWAMEFFGNDLGE